MKNKTLWRLILVLIIIIIGIIILRSTGVIGGVEGITVAVDTVKERNIIETVVSNGKIYPVTEVKIKPDVSGEIVELNIEEGDSVIKGQVLLKINPSIYSSAVTQAEASMKQSRASVNNAREMMQQSKAQFERAKVNYERNKELFDKKVISKMEYEQFQTDYLTAKAGYEAALANVSGGRHGITGAQANLSQAVENLRRTTITAPVTGIVSQLLVKKGERVVGTAQMDGTQILSIADLGKMELRVDISETDIGRVSIGDTGIIEADAHRNNKFTGIVTRISISSTLLNSGVSTVTTSSSADQVTNYTVHVEILPESYTAFKNELRKGKFPFKPGMSASVEIITSKRSDLLAVPINAVTTREINKEKNTNEEGNKLEDNIDNFKQIVFVYDKEKQIVVAREVKTGMQDNEYIEITEGLNKGDIVVSAPYGAIARQLKDKDKVKIVKKDQLYEAKP